MLFDEIILIPNKLGNLSFFGKTKVVEKNEKNIGKLNIFLPNCKIEDKELVAMRYEGK